MENQFQPLSLSSYDELVNTLTKEELLKLIAERWADPVLKMEDTFNIRKSDGSLIPLRLPEPHKKIIRDGILGKARSRIKRGGQFVSVIDKGRQIGFSYLMAAEMIMIAEEFPNTNQYYIATRAEQVEDWLNKLTQLIRDANHLPKELGGGAILHIQNIEKFMEKKINNSIILGLSANPAGARGHTGINFAIDEMAWQIKQKNQMKETWAAVKHFIRQGGQGRILSTPRVTDDLFYQMYVNPEKYGFTSYYCPVIENYKEIDINEPFYIDYDNKRRETKEQFPLTQNEIDSMIERYKDKRNFIIDTQNKTIKQRLKVVYPWVDIEELEKDRSSDIELFKQENMGIPVDESYKLYPSDLVYSNITDDKETEDRGDSSNPFYILCDFGQIKDITAITVVEKVADNLFIERRIEETQGKYYEQRQQIMRLFDAYKPLEIRIDNTGAGIPIGDEIEKELRDRGKSINILTRITFTHVEKEDMALGWKQMLQAGMYKFLNQNEIHSRAIRHVLKVEKKVTATTIQYSGKMYGRDDHWCSKMQIAYKGSNIIQAGLGKVTRLISPGLFDKKPTIGEKFMQERMERKPTVEEKKKEDDRLMIEKAIAQLNVGVIHCTKMNKLIQPLVCASCENRSCHHYRYMYKICYDNKITPEKVFKSQGKYSKDGKILEQLK